MGDDPWIAADPWGEFMERRRRNNSPVTSPVCTDHSSSHRPAVVIKCAENGTVQIHEHDIAVSFLNSLRTDMLQVGNDSISISIASAYGQGWRSRAAAKKANFSVVKSKPAMLATSSVNTGDEVMERLGVTESSIQARLKAVETAIRAQAQSFQDSGVNCHSPNSVLSRDQVALRNVAVHNFDTGVPFEKLTPVECRRIQRGSRKSQPTVSSVTSDMPHAISHGCDALCVDTSTTDCAQSGSACMQFERSTSAEVSSIEIHDMSSDDDGQSIVEEFGFSPATESDCEPPISYGLDVWESRCDEPACVVNLAIAASLCNSLITMGCVAMRVTFDETGSDEHMDVVLINVNSCQCNFPLAVHHNEDTVASELKLLLLEVCGEPAHQSFLSDAIFQGLNSHYALDESNGSMRLHGWMNVEKSLLSIVWNDLSDNDCFSDSDLNNDDCFSDSDA